MANPPNITNFETFILNVMGIAPSYLPSGAPVVQHAFDQAMNITNTDIGLLPAQTTSWSPYEMAVYNLGGHLLIEFAPDQSYEVSAASWSGGVVTLTTATHQIVVGDPIAVSGLSPLPYSQPPAGQRSFTAYAVPDNLHVSYLVPNPGPLPVVVGAGATVSERYFATARAGFKIASLVPGVVTSANDLSTGAGLLNPEFMRALTLENLQLLKTPFGRAYLSIAQKYGPTIWGLS